MAEGKRPARRVNRPAPPSPQDVAPSSQGVATVGEIARGTEYNAILGLASPKTIYIMDCAYTPEQAEQISRLRHERWNLLARFNEKHGSQDNEWNSMNHRMRMITKELFDLTGNPIYNA